MVDIGQIGAFDIFMLFEVEDVVEDEQCQAQGA
jgi:hypothetical protein